MKQKKQNKVIYIIIVGVLILAFSFYYWTKHPPFKPDFSAVIMEVRTNGDGLGGLLLSFNDFSGYAPGEIFVSVDKKTILLFKDTTVSHGFYLLKEGNHIEVALEGPVRESYPLQGNAKYIRIIK